MLAESFIADLRKQKGQLSELIEKLKRKDLLNEEEMHFYDAATPQIEKRLMSLRRVISREVSRNQAENSKENNDGKATKGGLGMKSKITKWMGSLTLFAFILSKPGFAQEADVVNLVRGLQDQMKQMQKTIEQQNDRIRRLESRSPQIQTAPAAGGEIPAAPPMSDYEFNERLSNATGGANKWLKDLTFKGDLRLRYEGFAQTSGNPAETDPRNRFRYRLRYGFEKKFNEDMKIGFSLASGEAANGQNVDPTSTNTSFDNNFNFKDIFIEKAFATYTPGFAKIGPIEKVTLTAGKMDNPFEKGSSDIVWDRDVKPEGAIEKIDLNLIDGSDFDLKSYLLAGQFILDEDSAVGGDANLFAWQAGLNPVIYTPFLERPVELLSAVSLYSYNSYAIKNNFLIGTTSLARGNVNADGPSTELDAGDFQIWGFYNEAAFYPSGIPVRPFTDWAVNTANQRVGENDSYAWALGTKIGGIVKKGDWEASYAYKRLGSEAVPGFNDSDFGAAGHSGHRGSVIKLGYGVTDNITFNTAAFFVNNLNKDSFSIRDEEQRRFQVDLVWKF